MTYQEFYDSLPHRQKWGFNTYIMRESGLSMNTIRSATEGRTIKSTSARKILDAVRVIVPEFQFTDSDIVKMSDTQPGGIK